MNYCVEVKSGYIKRLIDATLEPCPIHSGRLCLGRLINHASSQINGQSNRKCNVRLVDVSCNDIAVKGEPVLTRAVFVALYDIKVLEELMFDYGDKAAKQLFNA